MRREEIRQTLGNVQFFDGAEGVSKRLKCILEKDNMLNPQTNNGEIEFFDSSADEKTKELKKERFYQILNKD